MTANSEGTDDDDVIPDYFIADSERSDDDVIPDDFLPSIFNDQDWQSIVHVLGTDVSPRARSRLEMIAELCRNGRHDEASWRRNHALQIAALASTVKGARAFLDAISTERYFEEFFVNAMSSPDDDKALTYHEELQLLFPRWGEFKRRLERLCKIVEWLAEPPTAQLRADIGRRNKAWRQLAALFEELTGKPARVSVPPNGPFWHFMRAFYAAALPREDMPTGAKVREWIRKYWIPRANGEPNEN